MKSELTVTLFSKAAQFEASERTGKLDFLQLAKELNESCGEKRTKLQSPRLQQVGQNLGASKLQKKRKSKTWPISPGFPYSVVT